jgi:hypothetical protein
MLPALAFHLPTLRLLKQRLKGFPLVLVHRRSSTPKGEKQETLSIEFILELSQAGMKHQAVLSAHSCSYPHSRIWQEAQPWTSKFSSGNQRILGISIDGRIKRANIVSKNNVF